ncbi:hypothetical protein MBLNU230_g1471t1 [Neophaeotheca triangularis]
MFLRLYPSEKLLYIPIELSRFERLKAFASARRQSHPDNENPETARKMLSPKNLAGPGYIVLNGIRVANIAALLAIVAASVVMLVKTTLATQFFFFEAVGHVFTVVAAIFLVASELSLFRHYFARNWPLLSPNHGFVTLALCLIIFGVNMLGNLNREAHSPKNLGLAFWRIIIASGCMCFIMGWINLLASYVFRDRDQNITARQVRAHGAVAIQKSPMPPSHSKSVSSSSTSSSAKSAPSAPVLAQSYLSNPITPTKSGNNAFRILSSRDSRRNSLLPSYHTTVSPTKTNITVDTTPTSPPYPTSSPTSSNHNYNPTSNPYTQPISPTSRYSRATACTKKKVFNFLNPRNQYRASLAPPLPVNSHTTGSGNGKGTTPPGEWKEPEISGPMGVNPQFAHLVRRPDSALHPARSGWR